MRIAVLGGGTAGYMAAVQLTKYFGTAELFHIYDSRIPAIGVGEGTTPPFAHWIRETTGLGLEELRVLCAATHKDGIRFEDWGACNARYTHYFSPREGAAYHISADRIGDMLERHVSATHIDANVTRLSNRGGDAEISFEGGATLACDYVVDARGFPDFDAERHVRMTGIPTDRAAVRRSSRVVEQTATRAVARPYGWIFVIPLATHTSYGYLYAGGVTAAEEVGRDFDRFLSDEGVVDCSPGRTIRFPNFADSTPLEGRIFKIGNAASFLEPLEATAIGVVVMQLRHLTYWILERELGLTGTNDTEKLEATINRRLADYLERIELFVSWHYALGSAHDTEFWRAARAAFRRAHASASPEVKADFDRFVDRGATLPSELAFVADRGELDRVKMPDFPLDEAFGGFVHDSFAKVGHGIAFYES